MRLILILVAILTTVACSPTVQTSSGASFLAARDTVIDPDIAAAAAIEPDLVFPAKIGIGRINHYHVEAISSAEVAAIEAIELDETRVGAPILLRTYSPGNGEGGIHAARIAAAKQHLDYVLLYQLSQEKRGFAASGRADVYFVDVRNGYVYGRTSVEANLAGFGAGRRDWGSDYSPSDEGAAKLISAAAPDVAQLLNELVARAQSS